MKHSNTSRDNLLNFFNNKCKLCTSTKRLQVHHLDYKKGDAFHANYKGNTIKYYAALEPQVYADPERFALLCSACHNHITRLRRIKDDNRIRGICDMAINTKFWHYRKLRELFGISTPRRKPTFPLDKKNIINK